MKLIEAMKEIKRLKEKAQDLQGKIKIYCADLDCETPTYPDQKAKVSEWLQSVHDSIKQAVKLSIAIQKTNLATNVTIDLGEKESVTHSIAEWILRRRQFAEIERVTWSLLTNKNLTEGQMRTSTGDTIVVKRRLYFDPVERDKKVEIYRSEPNIIDRTLEVVNATTDIIE